MAKTDLETLVIALEARLNKYNSDMSRAVAVSDRATKKIEADWTRLEGRFSRFTGISAASIVPARSRNSSNDSGGFGVQVFPSKYFDVHVFRISSAGDARTLETAKRAAPRHMARFQSLGTT
jgi:hypothetical protein